MAGSIRNENDSPRSPIDALIAEGIGVPAEQMTAAQLEEYQLAEIRKLLYRLKKTGFYGGRLSGTDPESIRSFSDFRKLPLTSERDLAGSENEFLCVFPGNVKRMVTVPTTGTTGGSKRLAFTENDLRKALEFIQVAYTTFMHRGDRMMVMMSGGTEGSIGEVVQRSMKPLGIDTYIYGPVTDPADAYRAVMDYRPDVITGIPVQMAALARYTELRSAADPGRSAGPAPERRNPAERTADSGQPFGSADTVRPFGSAGNGPLRVREVLLSADDVPDSICRRLNRVWGAACFRHYGMTELCIAGGCECRADQGYHIRSNDHYFEILDPDAEGFGEIAVTTFHHEAMPLLRYRTGDIGRIDRFTCGCGSVLPRLSQVKGRIRNSILFPGGRLFLRELEEVLFSEPAVIDFECEAAGVECPDAAGPAGFLHITLKHFSGDMPCMEHVRDQLKKMPQLSGVEIHLEDAACDVFEKIYNSKKQLRTADLS